MEIIGKLLQKLPLQAGIGRTGNSWQKQEFVIETIEQYPKKVCANLWGDKLDMLDTVNIGDTVKVSFSIESREFNGKWYTDVRPFRFETETQQQQQQQVQIQQQEPQTQHFNNPFESNKNIPITDYFETDNGDDLPF